MGSMSKKISVLVALLVIAAMGEWEVVKMASAQPSREQCKQEVKLGISVCKRVIFRQNPSPACCQRAKVTNTECFCSAMSPRVFSLAGGVDRVIRLIEGCGRRVPRNFQCGGITTPP